MIYYLILILVIVGLCVVIWMLVKDKKEIKKEVVLIEKEKNDYVELGKGLAEYNLKLQEKKQQAKTKILEMLETKNKVSNLDVSKMLKISRSSVARYFDELEKEGKAKQVGKFGKTVYYQKIG